MANTDITTTLAGQFAVLNPRQLRLIELAAKMVMDTASGSVKPTNAQWQARLTTALGLFPTQCARDMQAQRAAVYWQQCILTINSGFAVAGRSNSQILDLSAPMQGLDDHTIDALSLYLEGKDCFFTNVFT